jgi:hypothetical protein
MDTETNKWKLKMNKSSGNCIIDHNNISHDVTLPMIWPPYHNFTGQEIPTPFYLPLW